MNNWLNRIDLLETRARYESGEISLADMAREFARQLDENVNVGLDEYREQDKNDLVSELQYFADEECEDEDWFTEILEAVYDFGNQRVFVDGGQRASLLWIAFAG